MPGVGLALSILGLVVCLVAVTIPADALAFWSTGTATPASGAASAATVGRGALPVVSVATQNDITVDWDATTLSEGTPVTGYTVTRYNTNGIPQTPTGGGCSGTVTGTVCTESNVPDGLWTYAVTPRFAATWVGPTSPISAEVRSDATPPVNNISRVAVSGGSFLQGTTVFYRGAEAGSFRLSNALTDPDPGSGPASSSTGAITATGWSHTAGSTSTPTGGPYESNPFSWTAGTTTQPSVGIAGLDDAGNTASTTMQFRLDNTAPTGGAITYPNGPTPTTSVQITLGALADTSGVASRTLQRRVGTLTDNACVSYSGFTDLASAPTPDTVGTTFTDTAVALDRCYQYRYRLVDNVGNVRTTTSPNTVKVRSYAAVVTSTTGVQNYWRLGEASGTSITPTTGTTTGTWTGGPALGAAGAIAGDPNTAVGFDGTNDYGRVSRTIQGTFSIELWFRSDQGLGTGTQWFNGAGLIDGDLGGVGNDFGISLLADGRVAAGVGNPDTTALSAAGFNNNVWHHVVMTRTQSNGAVQLYVDGVLRSTVAGGTQSLSGPAQLAFGSQLTPGNYFRGSMDEVAFYTTALPAATVQTHYRAGLP